MSRVARGINRGLNYTTRWPLQTQIIRRKPWWDTRDARAQEVTRPPEAGAQVRILPGAPSLTWEYDFLFTTCQYYLSVFRGPAVERCESTTPPCRILRTWFRPQPRTSADSSCHLDTGRRRRSKLDVGLKAALTPQRIRGHAAAAGAGRYSRAPQLYSAYSMTPILLDDLNDGLAGGVLRARCTCLRHHDKYEQPRGSG